MDSNFKNDVDARVSKYINSLFVPHGSAPPSLQNGVPVPQREYKKGTGNSPSANVKEGLVVFFLKDGSYLPVAAALRKDYSQLLYGTDPALPDVGKTVSVRFEWPGYGPQNYQLRTIDWSNPPNRIPVSKLATEVAKLIEKFIKDMANQPIAPEHAEWRVGPGCIQVEHLRLASFEQASGGSWQVRLFYKSSD